MTDVTPNTVVPLLLRRQLLWGLALSPVLLCACRKSSPQVAVRPRVELNVASDGDFLAFKPDELSCPTGALVQLIFHHAGKYITQDHNWVLVLPGTAEAVDSAAAQAGEANGWLPPHDSRIIAATPMCGKGQMTRVQFVAPAPGDYPFFCSTPGHGAVMHGVLHVTS